MWGYIKIYYWHIFALHYCFTAGIRNETKERERTFGCLRGFPPGTPASSRNPNACLLVWMVVWNWLQVRMRVWTVACLSVLSGELCRAHPASRPVTSGKRSSSPATHWRMSHNRWMNKKWPITCTKGYMTYQSRGCGNSRASEFWNYGAWTNVATPKVPKTLNVTFKSTYIMHVHTL